MNFIVEPSISNADLKSRYPVRMLPLLLFELALMAVIFIPLIPWRYVWAHHVRASGERWT